MSDRDYKLRKRISDQDYGLRKFYEALDRKLKSMFSDKLDHEITIRYVVDVQNITRFAEEEIDRLVEYVQRV